MSVHLVLTINATLRKWLNARSNCAMWLLCFFPLCVFPPWRVAGNSFITGGIYLSPPQMSNCCRHFTVATAAGSAAEIIPWAYRANVQVRRLCARTHTNKHMHTHKHTCKHIASASVSATVSSSHHFHIDALPPPPLPPPPKRTFFLPLPHHHPHAVPPPRDVVAHP